MACMFKIVEDLKHLEADIATLHLEAFFKNHSRVYSLELYFS